MIEFTLYMVLVGCLLAAAYLAAAEIRMWAIRRRQARVERVQREIAEAQQQINVLFFRHRALLREQALEARKAMILESYRASQESGGVNKNRV